MDKRAPGWVKGIDAPARYPMSPKLVREVLKDRELGDKETLVFLYMISRRMWREPSYVKEMSEDLGLGYRTVERAVRKLESLDYIYRSGSARDRVVLIAPPWFMYEIKKPTYETDIETDTVTSRHGLNGSKSKLLQTDIEADTTPKKPKRVMKPLKPRKSRSKKIQTALFDVGTNLTDSDDQDSDPLLPRSLDELYQDYLDQIEERFGSEVSIPSALTGQNRGQWRHKLVDGLLDEEGLRVGTMAMRLIVWDWEKMRKKWVSAFGDQPYPAPDAIWKLAERAIPLIEKGCRGTGKGSDRGPSKYARRFLSEEGGKTESISPLDW